MIKEQFSFIKVKTVLIFWNSFILLFTTSLFFVGLKATFKPNHTIYDILIFAISIVAGYLLSGIAKSNAKIYIDDGKMIVEQANSFIKRGVDITIKLNDLRGFEIVTTRYNTWLALYKRDSSTCRFLLENGMDSNNLKSFLAQYTLLLDAKANPDYSDLKKAFWFALKNVLNLFLFTIITWSILSTIIDLSNLKLALIAFSIPLLFWYFVTKKCLVKNRFRIVAKHGLVLLFPLIAIILLIPAKHCMVELISKALAVESPKNIFFHPHEKFFIIKNIRGGADKIIASYKINNNFRKSALISVSHFIETQATDLNGNFDNIWLRKKLSQKIHKSISEKGKTFLINEFQTKAKKEFQELINKKATFYKVILIRKGKHTLAILEPFLKSLNNYKSDVKRNLSFLIGGIIILLLIGTSIIAINR